MNPIVLSLIICSAIAVAFVAVIASGIRKKKQGNSSCGSCSGCPMNGKCHQAVEKKDK